MTPFEFYFSFYGLLLGLSVAQVARGIGHAVIIRAESRIGWLTPLLSLFILLDIGSFWIFAWDSQGHIGVSFGTIYLGLAVALAYYLATVLLFPVQEAHWRDLDAHYWANKRWVVIGIFIANAIQTAAGAVRGDKPYYGDISWWLTQLVYWIPLTLLIVSKRKRVDGFCLAAMVVGYIGNAVLPLRIW